MDSSLDISLDSTFDCMTNISGDSGNQELDCVRPNDFIDKIMLFYLRHNLTLVCLEDEMKLLNENREECDQLPTGKKQIIRLFQEHRDLIDIFYFVECKKCGKNTKIDSKSKNDLKCCGNDLKTTETNFFVIMPIENQIIKSVKDNWHYISKFDTKSCNDTISDAHDGAILKNVLKEYSDSNINILSLCLNIDGAEKFESNDLSVWPVQLMQNYLPPQIRFLPQNIIVAGFYYNNVKLNCREYLLPLILELKHLNDNNITQKIEGEKYTFKPIITHCAVDLPAKHMLQETKQFGGYDACTYCEAPGQLIKLKKNPNATKKKGKKATQQTLQNMSPTKNVRYLEGEKPYKLRDETDTLKKMLNVAASNSKTPVDGIKDVSCLIGFEHFHIILSNAVDYMHCILLGVTKRLLNLFCNPKHKGMNFYIGPRNRRILDAKILSIKPTSNIVRKPRSIFKRSNFKASEFRSMLLYYLPICLSGCVPNVYVQHVRQLSAAVYTLLKSNISRKEIDRVELMLFNFVNDHQQLFGEENMVMNVHLLKHLAESVRQLGPLWCQSTFPFERNNGCLLKLINGTSDVLHQLSTKYSLLQSIAQKKENAQIDSKILLGKSMKSTESLSNVRCIDSSVILNHSNVVLDVHKRIKWGRNIYTSVLYTRPKKSIDYFIGLNNEIIGMAKFYLEFNGKIYVMLEEFEVIDNIHHIFKVQTRKQDVIAPIDAIETKYLYMKIGLHEYVVSTPNPYENE